MIIAAVFGESFSLFLTEYVCELSMIFLRDETEVGISAGVYQFLRQFGNRDLEDLDISLFEQGLERDGVDHRHCWSRSRT
jgi:hypothetical protein